MKLINEDTMRGRELTAEQAAKLKAAMDAGTVTDEFGDLMKWDEVTDLHGDIAVEQGGFENCLAAAGLR